MLHADQLDAVAAAFATLGSFHRVAPDDAALRAFRELIEEWPLPGPEAASRGLDHMRASIAAGESAQAIRRDHDLLYGDSAVARVAPYESVHRGVEGLVFDEQTLQVREAYRSLALRAPRLNREPDDHIGLEFDFIARSCLKALDALDIEAPADAQRYVEIGSAFLRDHLLAWAPAMLAQADELAGTRFMKGLAQLSLGALEAYADLVGVRTARPAE